MAIPIAFKGAQLRAAAKRNRAMWSVEKKVWITSYGTAVALGVHNRVIEGLAEKCSDVDMFVE